MKNEQEIFRFKQLKLKIQNKKKLFSFKFSKRKKMISNKEIKERGKKRRNNNVRIEGRD